MDVAFILAHFPFSMGYGYNRDDVCYGTTFLIDGFLAIKLCAQCDPIMVLYEYAIARQYYPLEIEFVTASHFRISGLSQRHRKLICYILRQKVAVIQQITSHHPNVINCIHMSLN